MKSELSVSINKHLPVDEGKCNLCHNPHGSKLKYQLLNTPNELCLTCHERIVTTTSRKGHIAMEEGDCLTCHVSHYSSSSYLLKDSDPSLCLKCHSADTEQLLKVHRTSLDEIDKCMSCHEPHVTEGSGMLKKVLHEPFNRGNCEACHE
jgi:predicted CXXCH cytochrome family protein